MTSNQNFVGGENQTQLLFLSIPRELGKNELVKRQQQALFSRPFDFDAFGVRVVRPTFWCFCAHVFVCVDGVYDEPS